MKRSFALPLLLLPLAGCGGSSSADQTPEPSVLVSLAKPARGSLPQSIEAFGSAAPGTNGAQTISVAQPGQVIRLAVTSGTAVRAGQVLGTFMVAPTARGAYLQAEEALAAAQKQRDSTAQLLTQQLATRDQLVQAEKAVSDARVALAGLRAEGADQAVQTLTAPFDGVVTTITVAQGDRTQPGAPLLTVARAGGMVVTVGIDPAQRASLAAGQRATLRRLSGGPPLTGQVVRVGGALNARTRMVDVDLNFPAGALMPGEGMQVAIETAQVAGWVVPHKAVVTADGPAHIFQVAGGKAKAVPIHILLASAAGDVIEGAIEPARPIIVEGAYQVNDGIAVRQGR
ncbi:MULTISPECIES: efflux RND transporter periplasmic adaptor subunit [Sphingomonadaceae]|jgi:RND family efflux transporter MFP subunit|uniref:efflux RND transporter periplasmic adaptor subunit n=1 Tax=Sphingomonadales TaxID=204457 RepID=UPI000A38E462|nr:MULTISPECIES: efflux RND transporter periplasmic adaptor subunit [Sphingomonadaceae]OUC52914.1 efflux transporter periplasmic adaptor subunit [Sphingobium sp. GW456-12-10-14-TSB1]QCI92948.1 efflux RND transporter periplasmic adaptor subunit [Novosphingobium sp. EMRT-2]